MDDPDVRSPLERFQVPHQFTPRLTLFGAVVAVGAALTQIVGGSVIGALWGIRIWLTAVSNHSDIWKGLAILALAVGMLISLGALIWIVRAVTGRLIKQ